MNKITAFPVAQGRDKTVFLMTWGKVKADFISMPHTQLVLDFQ